MGGGGGGGGGGGARERLQHEISKSRAPQGGVGILPQGILKKLLISDSISCVLKTVC